MRLPQDRILHIDTEFKDGKVNIVAEWQGEIVRCKDCRWSERYIDLTGQEQYECIKWDEGIFKEDDFCSYGERREP